MSASGLDVFDKTLQTTHIWLDELMQDEAVGRDRQVAWYVLGVVLRAVRDRIPLELAVHLGSQLPLLVRGLYYDQWHAPGRMDEKPRSLDAFLAPIGERLNQILALHTGQPLKRIQDDTERDYIMGPDQGKEYGIIDDVIRKRA